MTEVIGGLTQRQHQAYVFIKGRCEETGISPSYQEICDALKLHSKSGVSRLVHALQERGFIHLYKNRSRSIGIVLKVCKNCGASLE